MGLRLLQVKMEKLIYCEDKKIRTIKVKICKSPWSKFSGLMFRKNSPPLLFIFNKEIFFSIHSFFCKPFTAIWLDKNKKVTKKVEVNKWFPNISGKGKYLLEIPKK
jgi:uncharacterized membrane protein (UPF0127 family)